MRFATFACGLLFLFGVVLNLVIQPVRSAEPKAAKEVELTPDFASQAKKTDVTRHQVDFRVIVTAPHGCKKLSVWLPLPRSTQLQTVSSRRLSTFPQEVKPQIATEPKFGNQFAYFEFDHPQGAQIIRHQFSAETWNCRWDVDFNNVEQVSRWPASFAPYLESAALAESQDYQQTLAKLMNQNGAGVGFRSALDWIDQNMTYSHANASLQADEEHAFREAEGHCSDYHGLCATFGRSLGLPTRVTYGLAMFAKDSPSHCKLEAFLPPYGWVSFDLSETQKLCKAIAADKQLSAAEKEALVLAARQRFHRGFRDNTWLAVTRGVNYELAPRASKAVRIVRTIYAEADGEPLPEPDPGNSKNSKFAWMTAVEIKSDPRQAYPFKDWSSLAGELKGQ